VPLPVLLPDPMFMSLPSSPVTGADPPGPTTQATRGRDKIRERAFMKLV
jgi:hypothetical protein